MKVAYFTESLPPSTDGVSRTLTRLAECLDSNRIEFRFFSPFMPDTKEPWADRVKKVKSVPFPLYRDYKVGLPIFEKLFEELDYFEPDIIHSASPTLLGMHGLSYAEKRNLPAVSSYHTHFVSYFKYYGFHFAEKIGWKFLCWFHNRCKMTFAPSKSAVTELKEKGIKDVDLWQRGIDLQKFSPNHRDMDLRKSIGAENQPILLFVGRLVKEKDLDDLVLADKILKAQHYQYKIVIVGDGPMKEELMEMLPEAHFTGYQYGHNLSKWYASSDLFVFPSTTETFGNVILEAHASGLPAVIVNKGGVIDVIDPDITGLIAKANNPEDFALKIKIVLKDKKLRDKFSKNAIRHSTRFSWQTINQRLIDSYKKIIFEYQRN